VKPRIRLAVGAAALATMIAAGQSSQAAIVNWTLSDGEFSDGGAFAGTFTFDTGTDSITAWDITTTGPGRASMHYGPGGDLLTFNSATDNGGPNFFFEDLFNSAGFNLSNLSLSVPGTVTNLIGSEGFVSLGFIHDVHLVTGGEAVGVLAGGVPEPATWAMMILGAGLAGASLRRNRRAVAGA
jgi:hypothetical protein